MLLAMSLAEALETTRLPRVADRHIPCVSTRPFRASHPTLADVGWIGGGQMPMPGEVSLAHHGPLCLDKLPEFKRHVLEVLRQPLEESIL
jgi:magnesium chelatase family protein